MIRKKVKLVGLIKNLNDAARELNAWADKELSSTEDYSDLLHAMFSDGYPFTHCFNETTANISEWHQAVIDHKIVSEEIVQCDSDDRLIFIQKTFR